jgi:hypothetical protein
MTTKSLQETLTDTKNNVHEEARAMKAEIRISKEGMEAKFETTRREFQTKLKEILARDERGRGTGTDEGAAKYPKFHGTASWVVFRRQFETVTEQSCWMRLAEPGHRSATRSPEKSDLCGNP